MHFVLRLLNGTLSSDRFDFSNTPPIPLDIHEDPPAREVAGSARIGFGLHQAVPWRWSRIAWMSPQSFPPSVLRDYLPVRLNEKPQILKA